jgi:LacI family transcriptional regulator
VRDASRILIATQTDISDSAALTFEPSTLPSLSAYEALHQSGLNIPNDISVAGFNDSEARLMAPSLPKVKEFPEELGKHLAEFVLSRIQKPDQNPNN